MNHRFEQFAVHQIKALRIDVEHGQRAVCNVQRDLTCAFDIRVVAHPAQQAVRNARRATRAPGNLKTALVVGWHLEQASAALDDASQLLG